MSETLKEKAFPRRIKIKVLTIDTDPTQPFRGAVVDVVDAALCVTLEDAEREIASVRKDFDDAVSEQVQLSTFKLEAEVTRLRKALEAYADPENWSPDMKGAVCIWEGVEARYNSGTELAREVLQQSHTVLRGYH